MDTKYNLQPYKKNGETKGFRTLKWYEEQVFCPYSLYSKIWEKPKSVLDVGCGNGRLFPLIPKANTVIAIDPIIVPREYPGIEFLQQDFMATTGSFDQILFLASFWIIWKNYGKKFLKHISKNLTRHGVAFALVSTANKIDLFLPQLMGLFDEVKLCLTNDKTSVVILFQRESLPAGTT